jgi:hypothetical protein
MQGKAPRIQGGVPEYQKELMSYPGCILRILYEECESDTR